MRIRDSLIGPGNPCYVIAEAGSNHAGSLHRAHQLIDVAQKAGADAVKFQLWRPEDIWDREVLPERPWWADPKYGDISEMLPSLHEHAHAAGLDFIVSPFSQWAVEQLLPYVDAWKIASCEAACDFPFRLAQDPRPVICSLGRVRGTPSYADALLHCTTMYPTPYEQTQLNRLFELVGECDPAQEDFGAKVWGLSSHTDGDLDVLAAVALGANIIEKHFCLDNGLQVLAPDAKDHSLEPFELECMIRRIRVVESMFTDFEMQPYKPGRKIAGKRP